MKQSGVIFTLFFIAATISLIACSPSIKTTASWVNMEKMPPQPITSVFIIALTENLEAKSIFENDLANAAQARGLAAFKCIDAFGPVGIKEIAPHKDIFSKKLNSLNCETIFTIALVDKQSDTKFVQGTSTTFYSPYGYSAYGGYNSYGGFDGYYGYSATVMASPGYYATDKKYFLEAKLFDVKTEELLLSIQSRADNPSSLKKASKEYTQTLMDEVKRLGLPRK